MSERDGRDLIATGRRRAGQQRPTGVDTAMDATTAATIAERGLRRGRPWPVLSQNQKDVNTARARQRGPGDRANAQLKSWKVLRSCPARATELVNAVQVLILAG